ncbi:MAG: gamma-glutamylcyclotransferase family protein [Myxococcota bacterium]
MSELYFAYGSNLDADQMGERCPGSRNRFRARLPHHRLDFTHYSRRWSGGAADVVPHRGSLVWGIVYERVDFVRLDRFEGGYERVVLQVLDDDDRMHDVTTYCVLDKGRYPPSELYVEKMLRWAKRWKFPESYLSQLPTPTRPQPHPR